MEMAQIIREYQAVKAEGEAAGAFAEFEYAIKAAKEAAEKK